MREFLQEIFQHTSYQPLTYHEIKERLEVSTEEEERLLQMELERMISNYEVFWNKKKTRFLLPKDVNLYKGRIEIARQGYGFIISDTFDQDLFVAIRNLKDATNKDTVLFKTQLYKAKNEEKARLEAVVVEVLERNLTQVIGEVFFEAKRCLLDVVDIDKEVEIMNPEGLKKGFVVKGKIIDYLPTVYKVEVVSILGGSDDVGMDIAMIAAKYDFPVDFNIDTLEQVRTISDDYQFEVARRKNVSRIVITIDGADAKDLDDAISIEKLNNGNYLLGVYIADVSYFVRENTPLDKEALSRGTSVYLVDRVIPMLPKRLSNHLCSLNPIDDKLVLACDMEIDANGDILSTEVYEASIKSNYRMTYEKCNQIFAGNEEAIEEYREIYPVLQTMKELTQILEAKRRNNGALDFDIPEGKIIVDDVGKVQSIELRSRGISERLIESFMIAANESVASLVENLDLPFIYRVHDRPNVQKLELFQSVATNLGYTLKSKGSKITQRSIQAMLEHVKEEDKVINTLLLRMMAKAVYSEQNIGHYGLASPSYTHFTSPIRRYPDLLVHRLLRKYIINGDVQSEHFLEDIETIRSIASQSSKKERDAIECEYEVMDMKKAEYMEQFIGQQFDGIIASITGFGMFVELPNTVDGLVRLRDLQEDCFEYDPKTLTAIGKRSKRYFRVGQKVTIEVASANKKRREIDFKLVYNINDLPKQTKGLANSTSNTQKKEGKPNRMKKGNANGSKKRRRKK